VNPGISSLTIKGFRSIRQLEFKDLGRVNLITGRNNTGKSSILEALRILVSDASAPVLSRILRDREEDLSEGEESSRSADTESPAAVGSLFSGFPHISEIREPINLRGNGGNRSFNLTISVGLFYEQREPDGSRRLVEQEAQLGLLETGQIPALVIESGTGRRKLPLEHLKRYLKNRLFLRGDVSEEPRPPCVFVSPYGGERTANLGPMWDKIALSDQEKEVVQALRVIDPDITAVSMVGGGEAARQFRSAIVRSTAFPRPVPLRSFGDGLNRLFGIVLSLVNAKDGFLLIDEFENGMHHTIQFEVWRTIFQLSKLLNVQVFATSHSWDAVQSFQKAAAEEVSAGLLLRLSRKGDALIATSFREDELAVASRENIEVR
jgi:predicted ATPase